MVSVKGENKEKVSYNENCVPKGEFRILALASSGEANVRTPKLIKDIKQAGVIRKIVSQALTAPQR
jgi:hypothetical protein